VLDRMLSLCTAGWAIALDDDQPVPAAIRGTPPAIDWLRVYLEGSRSSDQVLSGEAGPDDILWAPLGAYALVIGRDQHPFRQRERRRFLSFVRVADARLRQIVG